MSYISHFFIKLMNKGNDSGLMKLLFVISIIYDWSFSI